MSVLIVRVGARAVAACVVGLIGVDSIVPSNAQGPEAGSAPGQTLPAIVVTAPKTRPKAGRASTPPRRPVATQVIAQRRPTTAPIAAPPIQNPDRQTTDQPGSSAAGAGLGGRFTGHTADFGKPASSTKDGVPIMQVPANIEVVTRQTMDDHQDISVKDAIVGWVSSVMPPSITPSSSNFYDGFNIRGFDNANIYRNNLRVWEITGIETTNLQSIEVLKGLAAMLYGRLEPGGIVNLIVKRPLDYYYTSIQEQLGSYGLTRTTIDTTGPATADKTWLYRVNFDYNQANSFTDFVSNKNVFVAPTISYRPNNQFRFNIDYEYQNTWFVDNSLGQPAVNQSPPSIPIGRYLQDPALTVANPNRQIRNLVGYDWTYDFNKSWSLTNRFAFSDQQYRQFLNTADSFDQTTGELTRAVWDANVHARTFAANLDLKGSLTTGVFDHAVARGCGLLES